MLSLQEAFTLAAAIGSGLIAGLCFAFGSFILGSLDRLGASQAIRTMQAINAQILRSTAMVAWMGTIVAGVLATVLADERALVGTATGLYTVGALLITGRGNVPLNESLDRVNPEEPEAEARWQHYRTRWSRWNAVRTVLFVLASAGFSLAS